MQWTAPVVIGDPMLTLAFGDRTASPSHSDSFRMDESLLGTLAKESYEEQAMTEWESDYWPPTLGLQYNWRNGTSLGNE
jgi:hypothetical protein